MAESDATPSGDEAGSNAVPSRPPKRARTADSALSDSRGVSAGVGAVCKLFVKRVPCNFADPWRKQSQTSVTGTGFLVRGQWIVTNAHVIHRAVSILVRATMGPPIKYSARVVAIGLPCDLAVLEVPDPSFWSGKEPLDLSAQLPRLDDNVTCIGFPVGGDNICVTRGVVSRIDVNSDGLLRIQIDAAINPGNSGGPVLGANGLVVGVASSHLKNASNIGYIIPTSVLEQFLQCCDTAGAPYTGVASLGIGWPQTLESPALRRGLKLPGDFTGGVLISSVWPLGPAAGILRVGDVILKIDDVEIGQDGTVPLRDNERISFMHLLTRRLAGRDVASVEVLRDGDHLSVRVPLRPDQWLVPRIDGYDAAPEYTIVGGLLFVPLSRPWAELKPNDKNARALMLEHYWAAVPEEGCQLIILSKVLAHPCNVGYHTLGNIVLHSFNSIKVRNVAELARAVFTCTTELLTFEFLRPGVDGKEIVMLDNEECRQAEKDILKQHLIASSCMVREDGCGDPRPLSLPVEPSVCTPKDGSAIADT